MVLKQKQVGTDEAIEALKRQSWPCRGGTLAYSETNDALALETGSVQSFSP
jgi:hypothetical protein